MRDWIASPGFLLASSVIATMLCLTVAVGIARAS
jgi:hypothetical protein